MTALTPYQTKLTIASLKKDKKEYNQFLFDIQFEMKIKASPELTNFIAKKEKELDEIIKILEG